MMGHVVHRIANRNLFSVKLNFWV